MKKLITLTACLIAGLGLLSGCYKDGAKKEKANKKVEQQQARKKSKELIEQEIA